MFSSVREIVSGSPLLRSRSSIDETALGRTIEAPRAEQYEPSAATRELIERAGSVQEVAMLAAHREHAAGYLANGYQADFTVSEGDMRVLPLIIEAENARKPGLNLVYCDDEDALRGALNELRDARDTTHRRLLVRPNPFGHHHFMLDALAQPGKPISLIEFEPVDSPIPLPSSIEPSIKKWGFEYRLSSVLPRVQKSNNDCIIFSLSHALKSHASEVWMRRQHAAHLEGKLNVEHTGGALPESFYKHLQSSSRLKKHLAAREMLDSLAVNGRGETLARRFYAHLAKDRRGHIYSISIELKRLKLLDRAIAYFAARQTQAT